MSSYEINVVRTGHRTFSFKVRNKRLQCNDRIFLCQPVKIEVRTYDNIRKIATGQENDYTIGCLLDYACIKEKYELIAIALNKQQALDADPKVIQQINFTGNLEPAGNTIMFFINEEVK